MKKQAPFKLLAFVSVLLIVMVGFIYEIKKTSDTSKSKKYISSKEKAEAYVEEMKPKIEEELGKEDIHHFIKSVTFEDKVTINPMGRIVVNGYINDNPDKFYFSADLIYDSNKVDGMSYSEDVGNRFTDWSEYSKEVKEKYIKTAYPDKKEREQYLRDIGE
ncbi:DUF1433 domain-containing protein [Bacillus cabrialesii]